MADQNHLAMSDEDFEKLNGPPAAENASAAASEEGNKDPAEQDNQGEVVPEKTEGEQKPDNAGEPAKQEEKPAGEGTGEDGASSGSKPEGEGQQGEKQPENKTDAKPEGEAKAEGEQGQKEEQKDPDYKGFYERILSQPIAANGKKINVRNPEEAIALMQMGANYTQKLQAMAPHRKLITMLGNNGMLDEGKLSFFIDLDKGDPEAIKKFLKDRGVDPLDIDTKTDPAYQPGSHAVSDDEVAFRTQLDEISSTDTGKQTLQDIDKNWDDASKEALWQQPEVLRVIHDQREAGIYQKIVDEMDRQRTVGKLPSSTPFLDAYKTIGDQLHAAGAFGQTDGSQEQQSGSQGNGGQQEPLKKDPPAVVATDRAAPAPKPDVDNGDKAGAAAPSRASGSGKAQDKPNYLAMSDEDFAKAANLSI